MDEGVRIERIGTLGPRDAGALAELLVDCVDGGASVGFLSPLSVAKARAWWDSVSPGIASGERWLLVARAQDDVVLGTVQVIPAAFENQPERADVAKMLVHRRARRRGVGLALLRAAEALALAAGRTLLVLDTAGDEAARLYARAGWRRCGTVPRYALWPDGRPCATQFFFRDLAEHAAPDEPRG